MAAELTFKDIGEADMIAFLGYDSRVDPEEAGFIGLADGPSACQPCDKDMCDLKTITEWTSTAAAQGSVCLKLNFLKVHFTHLRIQNTYLFKVRISFLLISYWHMKLVISLE